MEITAVFNLNEALARVDDDMEFLRTLMAMLLEQAPGDLRAIRTALAAGDPDAVARTAHHLKGAVLQFSSPALYASLKELEALGRAGRLECSAPVFAQVETGLQQLLDVLRAVFAKGECV